MKRWAVVLVVVALLGMSASLACAAWTERVSVGSGGTQANGVSASPSLDRKGDLVVFASDATNLIEGDTNGCTDIYASYRGGGIFRVSVDSSSVESNGASTNPCISANGNSVAYGSVATNLVSEDANDAADIFVTDIYEGGIYNTYLVSVNGAGDQADGASSSPSISLDGNLIAFASDATNLEDEDTNGVSDIFVRDRSEDATTRVSVSTEGDEADGASYLPMISANGRYVVFISEATNLVPDDTNGVADVFIRDLLNGTTERVSVSTSDAAANGHSDWRPAVNMDGRLVAFASSASNLVDGDTNGAWDIFLRDLTAGTTTRVSIGNSGGQANGDSTAPSINLDGRFVGFASVATNLVADDANGVSDVFVRDLTTTQNMRFSIPSDGTPVPVFRQSDITSSGAGAAESNGPSMDPAVAMALMTDENTYCCTDGRWNVAFSSHASNLVPEDTNAVSDVFLRSLLMVRNGSEQDLSDLQQICFNRRGWEGDPEDLDPHGTYKVNGNPITLLPEEVSNYTKYLFRMDQDINLELTPDPGWEFVSWECCNRGNADNPILLREFVCLGMWAKVHPIPYTVTIDKTGDGTITVNDIEVDLPYSATYYYNDELTITAAAGVGHVFSGWSGDASGTDNPLHLVIADDLDIVAHFPLPTVSLTAEGVGSGSVKVNDVTHALPWNGVFDAGAAVTLEAVPAAGQLFVGWSGYVTGDGNPVDFVLLDDAGVTASFGTSVVTLTVNGEPGASLKVNGEPHAFPWSGPFPYGASVTLEAIPGYCSRFDGWSGSVSSMANPLVLAMTGSKTVTASFGSISVFTDIGCGSWAAREIAACADAGIVTGYPDGTYLPEGTVDRAGMAVFIARALAGGDADIPSGPATPTFSDVPADHWAYKYVEYASANHIVVGYGDGTYAPATTVDRGQMAVFIARAIVDPLGDEGLASYTPPATPSFDDVTDSNDWAWCHKYVEYLHDQVIVAGYPDGLYHPESVVTRDQMAVYIARAFDLPL